MASVPFSTVFSSIQGQISFEAHAENDLYLEFGPSHISLSIVDPINNKLMEVELVDLNETLSADSIRSYITFRGLDSFRFKHTKLLFNTKEFALIPSKFHNPILNRELVETIHGDLLDLQFSFDRISYLDVIIVYGVQREINTLLDEVFANAQKKHKNACILNTLSRYVDAFPEKLFKIHFSPSYMDVLIIKQGKFQFLQKFYHETPDDAIYFLLSLSEKFHFNNQSLDLMVGGQVDSDSILAIELKKYFPSMKMEDAIDMNIDSQLSGIPSHFLTPVIISTQCG